MSAECFAMHLEVDNAASVSVRIYSLEKTGLRPDLGGLISYDQRFLGD